MCYRLLRKSVITIGIAPHFYRVKVEFGWILRFWSRLVGFSKDVLYSIMKLDCQMSIRGVKHVLALCMLVLGREHCDKVVKNVVKSVVKSVVVYIPPPPTPVPPPAPLRRPGRGWGVGGNIHHHTLHDTLHHTLHHILHHIYHI